MPPKHLDLSTLVKRVQKEFTLKIPTLDHMPLKNDDFLGRGEILDKIHEQLTEEHRILVLHGPADSGKTQLAQEYAHRNIDYYTNIVWLQAYSRSSLENAFLNFARRLLSVYAAQAKSASGFNCDQKSVTQILGLDCLFQEHQYSQQEFLDIVVKVVLEWFDVEVNQDWLIIYDDCRELSMSDLARYMPISTSAKGNIIITTRSKMSLASEPASGMGFSSRGPVPLYTPPRRTLSWSSSIMDKDNDVAFGDLAVSNFELEESCSILQNTFSQFLKDKGHNRDEDIKGIAAILNGSPLLMAQAVAYVRIARCAPAEYRRHLCSATKDIEKLSAKELEWLDTLCMLSPCEIPMEVITENRRPLCDHITTLLDAGHIIKANEGRNFFVHHPVRNARWVHMRNSITINDTTEHPNGCGNGDGIETRSMNGVSALGVNEPDICAECDDMSPPANPNVVSRAGNTEDAGLLGEHDAKACQLVLEAFERQLYSPAEEDDWLQLYTAKNKNKIHNAAKKAVFEQKLVRQTTFNRRIPARAENLAKLDSDWGTLAELCERYGRFEEAEAFYRAATIIGKRKEKDSATPELGLARMCLEHASKGGGYLEEAETLCSQVKSKAGSISAKMRRTVNLGGSVNLLYVGAAQTQVRIRAARGQWIEADTENRQLIEELEDELGVCDPYTLTAISHLVALQTSLGHFNEAELLLQRMLMTWEQHSGLYSSKSTTSLEVLALLSRKEGALSQARLMYERILQLKKDRLGQWHIETVRAMANLAQALDREREFGEAKELYDIALAKMRRSLGEGHPEYVKTAKNARLNEIRAARSAVN